MSPRRHAPTLLAFLFAASGCSIRGPVADDSSDLVEGSGSSGAGAGGSGGPCQGPLGAPVDPSSLPACGAGAHCLPSVAAWPALAALAGPCEGGGFCVPDALIATGGLVPLATCTAFGGAGACLSLVFPEIAKNQQFLGQDACNPDERCAPCVSPLDQTDTGACDLHHECPDSGGASGSGGAAPDPGNGDDPNTCEYDGAPIVDPGKLPPCPASVCGSGGHCVPAAQVPPEMAGQLAACDASSFCVPDPFLIAGGDAIAPKTCSSLGGNEGRCMSTCLPPIAEQAGSLPKGPAAGCDASEACVPCYDPITGKDTGACSSLPCDQGPKAPPKTFPKCCGGVGTCIPLELVPPEDWNKLGSDVCGPLGRCTPDAFLPGTTKLPFDETNQPCETDFFLWGLMGDKYRPGVCLPTCIPEVGDSLLGQGSCNGENYVCAPCFNPLDGKPSGACGAS